jgi:PAS domain S-box-containing protein
MTGLQGLPVPRELPQESAALIMLAAGLLVFRTFREKYLLVWVVGWLAYLVSRWPGSGILPDMQPLFAQAVGHAGFALAVALFAASVLIYSQARWLLMPLAAVAAVTVVFAGAQAVLWPHDPVLRAALEVMYRSMTIGAALSLMAFTWGRWRIGPWLLAVMLLALHLEWGPIAGHMAGIDILLDGLLGTSMLMIVLDHYRDRNRRLSVVTVLTGSIARSQHPQVMLQAALHELVQLTGARAGWFRALDGNVLKLTQHQGISDLFVQSCANLALDETLERVLRSGKAAVIRTAKFPESSREALRAEGFHHVIVVPVKGKKAVIGTMVLAQRHRRSYLPEELNFLGTTANQMGIAAENLRLREQIVRSQRQWINTFDSIEDLILVHDSESRIIKVNRAMIRRLKRRPVEIVGKLCAEVLPQDAAWTQCPYCGTAGLSERVDPCFGGYSLVSSSTYVEHAGKRRGIIHVVRDTTESRTAEEKYRLLFEQAQEGLFVADVSGRLLDCNNTFVRMLGYGSREEVMALNLNRDIYVSADQQAALMRELQEHDLARNFEVQLKRKDGSLLTAVESSSTTRNARNEIERYQGFLLDMSEKRRAEEEIRRRNRELNALNAMATIANQSFDMDEILNLTLRQVVTLFAAETGSIYLADADQLVMRRRAGWGHRSDARARFAEVRFPDGFGELILRSRTEVVTPEYLPHLPPIVAEFFRADGLRSWIWVILWIKDKPIGLLGVSSREAREFTSSDENLLVAIGRQLATTIEKVRLYEGTCRAYEDLRLTQEQLLQSEKMSAVGQLISGVAHELNNPLTAILGYAQLLEGEGLNERAQDYTSKLFKQAQRTHRVVQNLLSFARQRKPQRSPVDMRRVLEDTLALRDYDFKVNNIQVGKHIAADLPQVTGDSHQLEQVFLNILNNAVDAMLEIEHGGKLTVKAIAQDGFVCTEVHDSGPGIKDATRIFDPFYTTKSVGKGTGLGLSICYGIVKEHGGEIAAFNGPDGGAVLQVKLPAAVRSAPADPVVAVPRREFIQGRLLLVEDEEAVLEFERDVLSGAGAEVVAVANLESAQARMARESFDAVIMNGGMPGCKTVAEVHRWLAENCAGLEHKVLFTFAQVADAETRAFLDERGIPSLVKPFEVGDLIETARKLLRKAQAAGASA